MNSSPMQIYVPNSILFLRDAQVLDYPELDDESASFWSTSTCVIIQCLHDIEGATEVTFKRASEGVPALRPAFERVLDTPSRRIILEIVPREMVSAIDVPSQKTRVRIWTDGRHQCARWVVIAIG